MIAQALALAMPLLLLQAGYSPVEQDWRATFYDCDTEGFCGSTASGELVSDDVIACGYDVPLDTPVTILTTRRTRYCLDRGLLVKHRHLDAWHERAVDGWEWQRIVGNYTPVLVWWSN